MLFTTLLVSMLETAIATFVASRARTARAAQLFVGLMLALILLTIIPLLRMSTTNTTVIYALTTVSRVALGSFDLLLLLVLSDLFIPQWWNNRRVVGWISLPYVLAIALIASDAIGQFGLLVNGIIVRDNDYTFQSVQPGAGLMLSLFAVSWLPHIAILVYTFLRVPANRRAIGVLLMALVFMMALGVMEAVLNISSLVGSTVRIVPLMAALGYVVVFTQLIVPLQTAFER
ncbi:MAG: hypothetical protein H0T53_03610, partial [Herpetosiphonaceae bacterium]|nr:hypothetical protein [Herpetosiphonaceae bacterium]